MNSGRDISRWPVITFDPQLCNELLNALDPVFGESDQLHGLILAEQHQQRGQIFADGRRQVASVSAACAETCEVGFDKRDVEALAPELESRREPSKTAADYCDVCASIRIKRGT